MEGIQCQVCIVVKILEIQNIVTFNLLCLTHFRLNILNHNVYWKSPISVLGMSCCDFAIPIEKMAKLFTNNGDPDQTSQNAASDLGLRCLPITLFGVSRLKMD